MPVVINGSTGISGVDGSAGTPAFQGSDTNTGIRFGTDIVSLVTGGSDRLYIDSSGRLGVGTSSPSYALDVISVSGSSIASRFRGNASGNNNTQIRFYGNNAATDQWAIGGSIATNDTGRDFHIYDIVAGQNRLAINSSGFVGIGSTAPACALMVVPQGSVLSGTGNNYAFYINPTSTGYVYLDALTGSTNNTSLVLRTYNNGTYNNLIQSISGNETTFSTAGTERARIDSSGRLLVGTSTARSIGAIGTHQFSLEGVGYNASSIALVNNENSFQPAYLTLGKSRGTSVNSNTIIQNGDGIGVIDFAAADGDDINSRAARISVEIDGTPGNGDTPGRILFATTADGASSPTERMRIDSVGAITWANSDAIFESINTFADARIRGTSSGCNVYVQSNGQTGVYQSGTGWVSASSARLKNVVGSVDSEQCWDFVKGVNLYRYYFKQDPQEGVPYLGPMAEEIGQLDPEMLLETNQADEQGPIYSFNLPLMEMKAFAALQTALSRIEALEAEVAALKAQ